MNFLLTTKVFTRTLLLTTSLIALFTTSAYSDTNLSLGKHALQYGTYVNGAVASKAVDGNTDGIFNNGSVTHTTNSQGAWWKVDLGDIYVISRINIYNRTDCCSDRLSNYRVSVSNQPSFNPTTYQQDFTIYPNPTNSINVNARGRYVKIQLLGKNYLSLAEVQVMGSDILTEKGDTGAQGPVGPRGATGPKGNAGADGDTFFTKIGTKVSLQGQNDLVVTGSVQIGSSDSQCDASSAGSIRYNTAAKVIEYCSDASWKAINTVYNPSCGWACQLGSVSSLGGVHACVLKIDGSVECWGNNNYNQTTVPNGLIAKQIALGFSHSCALKIDGSVECWGDNRNNQTTVPSGLIAKQIALGHALSCALRTDNTIQCWGSESERNKVPNGLVVKQIALGAAHSCVLKTDNTVECWGSNEEGQSTVPNGLVAKQIALGYYHSCAITTDNTVECWGENTEGQVTVPNDLFAKQIALGWTHSCVIKTDNTVQCWGNPHDNRIAVPNGLVAKKIALGHAHSCAIKIDKTIECWGGENSNDKITIPRGLKAKQL
ncbi:MAG: hypothetical protein FE834_09665 [Gammaproteobacteria bacterium]|nr:hypothetical protein [Gammaproteobacteria bacterium]